MKRALCGAAAVLALGGAVAPAVAFACKGKAPKGPDPKVTFCHATSSATNPFVKITTSAGAVVHAHIRHHEGNDRYPAFTYRGKAYGDAANQAFIDAGCGAPEGGGDGGGGGPEL
jgi:ABC-type sugar transport system substrate-binding protein